MSILQKSFGMVLVLALAACAPGLKRPAPVEDRASSGSARTATAPARMGSPPTQSAPAVATPGGAGTYAVQRGDTLAKIALEHGVTWRDLARWNNIDNPNVIEVGQILRVTPPAESGPRTAITRPLPPQGARAGSAATDSTSPAAQSSPASSSQPAGTTTPPSAASDDAPAFIWPAQGNLVNGFDESRNKGLDIAGKSGDPVLAAADGRVVYAGSGLRGYGNLIILKHNNTYLTAYAHNQTLLVKEDQTVKKGQKIAEMGSSDADRVKLHFEVRRQGKPVDPVKYLPAR